MVIQATWMDLSQPDALYPVWQGTYPLQNMFRFDGLVINEPRDNDHLFGSVMAAHSGGLCRTGAAGRLPQQCPSQHLRKFKPVPGRWLGCLAPIML